MNCRLCLLRVKYRLCFQEHLDILKIFGHNHMLIGNLKDDIGGGSKCIRCGHTTPAIKWPRPGKSKNTN